MQILTAPLRGEIVVGMWSHVNGVAVITALAKKWHQNGTKATESAHSDNVPVSETLTPRPTQPMSLPQELVEIIASYLIYNTPALFACSLTCYSWYIAVVPHLHHSLTINSEHPRYDVKRMWPQTLQECYKLGLLPLVKRFRIRLGFRGVKFTPEHFDGHTLRYFSALTNLQELGIDNLQVPAFMPDLHRYFGHLAPRLRFLALATPVGSCRQILYFIGLFPNLQDFKLNSPIRAKEEENTPFPLSTPPLGGRLTLYSFRWEDLVRDMATHFGGLHFRYMDLFKVKCTRLLLHMCAETLDTLRLYPTDPCRMCFPLFLTEPTMGLRSMSQWKAEPCIGISIYPSTGPFGR